MLHIWFNNLMEYIHSFLNAFVSKWKEVFFFFGCRMT